MLRKNPVTGPIFGMLSAGILLLGGCYTQFAVIDRSPSDNEPVMEQGAQDTCTTCDSAKSAGKNRVDTVVVRDDRREVCYWSRNFWGDPVLKCVNTYYSRDWMVYNDYPWWYNERPYYYDSRGRCPRYYYYDADYGRCRYYTDTDPYYLYPGYRGSGSYGGGSYGGSGSSASPPSATRSNPSPMTQNRDSRGSDQLRPPPSSNTGKSESPMSIGRSRIEPSPAPVQQPQAPAEPTVAPNTPPVESSGDTIHSPRPRDNTFRGR